MLHQHERYGIGSIAQWQSRWQLDYKVKDMSKADEQYDLERAIGAEVKRIGGSNDPNKESMLRSYRRPRLITYFISKA